MIINHISVTTGVTKEDLREISTRGYDFYWPVVKYGYEWDNEERLAFSYYTSEKGPPFSDSIIPARYNKDALLYEVIIHGRSVYRPPFFGLVPTQEEPMRIHITRPWLVAKGNIDLQLKQDIKTTSPFKQKIVPTREYQPLSIKTLHRSFAALDTDNLEKEVQSFANKCGLLGRAVSLKIHPKIGSGVVYGESMYLWREEIEKMGILLAIWDLIRQNEAGRLGQIILWDGPNRVAIRFKWQQCNGQFNILQWDGKQKATGFGHHSEVIATSKWSPEFFSQYGFGEAIDPAWWWLGKKLNSHLYGIRPKLVGPHEPEVVFVPVTLLDALWLLFMLEVQGKVKVARCQYCDGWFELERSSKMYCSGNCRRLAFYHKKVKNEGGQP